MGDYQNVYLIYNKNAQSGFWSYCCQIWLILSINLDSKTILC